MTSPWRTFSCRRVSSRRFTWKVHKTRSKMPWDRPIFTGLFINTEILHWLMRPTAQHMDFVSTGNAASTLAELSWIIQKSKTKIERWTCQKQYRCFHQGLRYHWNVKIRNAWQLAVRTICIILFSQAYKLKVFMHKKISHISFFSDKNYEFSGLQ